MKETKAGIKNIHERVRLQHSSELSQDYLESIYELLQSQPVVRISDLKNIFSVSHVTVIRTLQRLKEKDFITDTRSKHIFLTEKGERIAIQSAEKHELLKNFFINLGVSPEQANADAEGAEHHLSDETFQAIRLFQKNSSST